MSAVTIEHYLLMRTRWVPAADIALAFHVDERDLRAAKGKPGLCSAFAISSNAGFKHVRHATQEEFDAFRERLRSHGLAELHRVAQLEAARDGHLSQTPPAPAPEPAFDSAGQGQFFA